MREEVGNERDDVSMKAARCLFRGFAMGWEEEEEEEGSRSEGEANETEKE